MERGTLAYTERVGGIWGGNTLCAYKMMVISFLFFVFGGEIVKTVGEAKPHSEFMNGKVVDDKEWIAMDWE